jgi:hypothetical protein
MGGDCDADLTGAMRTVSTPGRVSSASVASGLHDVCVEHKGPNMRLIEPDEHQDFLATLKRNGLAESDFNLLETDTTDPKGDENLGLQGFVTITRLSTQVTKEYAISDESDWLEHFRKDLMAGAFNRPH